MSPNKTSRSAAGGAATQAGINYQSKVAAWPCVASSPSTTRDSSYRAEPAPAGILSGTARWTQRDDLPLRQSVYHYFRQWKRDGTWLRIHESPARRSALADVA